MSHVDTIRSFIHDDSRVVPADIPGFTAQDEAEAALDALRDALVTLADNTEAYLDLEKDGQRNYPDSLRLCIEEARAALAGTPSEATEGEEMSKVTTEEAALVRKVLATTGYTAPMHERQEARRIVDKVLPPMHRIAGTPSEDTE